MGAASILADIGEAEAAVSAGRLSPHGVLRVTSTLPSGASTSYRRRPWSNGTRRRAFADRPTMALPTWWEAASILQSGWVDRPEQAEFIIHRIAANRRVVGDAPAYLARGHALHNAGSLPPSCLVIERASGPLDLRGAER